MSTPAIDDYYTLPTRSAAGYVQAVVEIPAGTNLKLEYDASAKKFFPNKLPDGTDRRIKFLGYPGNYGFIPSTLMDKSKGGDGDPLDVLILSETVPTGTVMEIIPIAALLLRDEGELDTKLIAIPAAVNQQTISVTTLHDFLIQYNAAMRIVQDWFVSYEGKGIVQFLGWEDEKFALEEITRWQVK